VNNVDHHQLLDRANRAVRAALGENWAVTSLEDWGGGAHNRGYQLHLEDGTRLFWKVEEETIFPRTRRGQVENEVTGLSLAAQAGVDCPRVIGYDFSGQVAGCRYLLAEFIDCDLLGQVMQTLSEAEQCRLWDQFQAEAAKLNRIHSNVFGNIYPGGPLGQHATLQTMMAAASALMVEDAETLGMFTNAELALIRQAHAAALPLFQYDGPAAFVHQDLHIFNVFAVQRNGSIEVGKLFDFGLCGFTAPYMLHYNEKAFNGQEARIARQYGVSEAELHACELISKLEMVNFSTTIRWAPDQPYGYVARMKEYLEMCKP
jgi:hypothetical protein